MQDDGEINSSDNLLHAALLTYQSDDALLSTSRLPHRGLFKRSEMQSASLDHAMWFHRPFRFDEWLLYVMESPTTNGGRGLVRGQIYNQAGDLVASTMQEGVIRQR